jgi:hypothetical protein
MGAKISTFRVPDAVQRERSEAVRRCSGTFTKVVCVTIHAGRVYPTCAHLSADLGQARDRCLQRTTRLRLALRCARDTPLILAPMGLDPAMTEERLWQASCVRSSGNRVSALKEFNAEAVSKLPLPSENIRAGVPVKSADCAMPIPDCAACATRRPQDEPPRKIAGAVWPEDLSCARPCRWFARAADS